MQDSREPTVSLRWVIPFLEVTGIDPRELELMGSGTSALTLGDPNTRLPHSVATELLERALVTTGDPGLGLKAGAAVDPASLGVPVLAARSCATLRHGIACANRYMRLFDESLKAQLIETANAACWQISTVFALPIVDDFLLAAAYGLACQCANRRIDLLEVRLRYAAATDAASYARVFGAAQLKFGEPHNVLVFRPNALDTPLTHAHQGLQALYEMRASALLERLYVPDSTTALVRQLTIAQLELGDASMTAVARRLGISVATLRRRLQAEETVFSEILDEVRRELAQEHLSKADVSMVEIAKLLGFSHVAAFYRAFRRWFHGTTPAQLRQRMQRSGHVAQAAPYRSQAV